jgi:hypothetical protein
MRGLDVRIMLAKARVMDGIHGVGNDYEIDVFSEAQTLGYVEATDGLYEPPVMFLTEPALLYWWRAGQDLVWGGLEMAGCSGCNNGTGDPCPCHG